MTEGATHRVHPTDEEVRAAEVGLQRVREDLARRQKDLQNLEVVKVRIQSGCSGLSAGAQPLYPVLLVPPLSGSIEARRAVELALSRTSLVPGQRCVFPSSDSDNIHRFFEDADGVSRVCRVLRAYAGDRGPRDARVRDGAKFGCAKAAPG